MFFKGFGEIEANPSSASTLASTDPGVDPFMNKTFCETFKIMKKNTYVLTTDHPLQLELKDSKYKRMKKNQWQAFSLLKNWSTGFLIIARGVPNGAGATDVCNLSVAYRRKYSVNVINDSYDRGGEN